MSKRESIASNVVSALTGVSAIKFVTREPFDFTKLSNAQFPAIIVQTATETRDDITIGGGNITREGSIEYQIIGYVKGTAIDTARNGLVELVEEALDADRTRGGYALDTQIVSVETDEGSISPIGGVIVTVRVLYNFTRGAV